jgi:aquaporin Z
MGFASELLLALRRHWRYYLVEVAGPAIFLTVSSLTSVVFHHPSSPVVQALGPNELLQRAGLALVIAATVMACGASSWGKRSGAHFNPAVTLGFWQLGHIRTADAVWYVLAQFTGALAAGFAMFNLLQPWFGYPSVHHNLTRPLDGDYGWALALGTEMAIAASFMFAILTALHSPQLKKWSSVFAGSLIAFFIVFESPISGMSLNPARSTGTAAAAQMGPGLWIYFVGPLAAMWATAVLYERYRSRKALPERPPMYPNPTA